jgi:hypothetical protein
MGGSLFGIGLLPNEIPANIEHNATNLNLRIDRQANAERL